MLPCLLFNSGLTVKSLFLSLFFYWMASQSSHSITSLMDFIECCTFLYLYYATSTYPMCWGLSFLYINKFLFTYPNKILFWQLRDDLMTMLIAGHETTAAVLTWAVFLLAQVWFFITNFWYSIVSFMKMGS